MANKPTNSDQHLSSGAFEVEQKSSGFAKKAVPQADDKYNYGWRGVEGGFQKKTESVGKLFEHKETPDIDHSAVGNLKLKKVHAEKVNFGDSAIKSNVTATEGSGTAIGQAPRIESVTSPYDAKNVLSNRRFNELYQSAGQSAPNINVGQRIDPRINVGGSAIERSNVSFSPGGYSKIDAGDYGRNMIGVKGKLGQQGLRLDQLSEREVRDLIAGKTVRNRSIQLNATEQQALHQFQHRDFRSKYTMKDGRIQAQTSTAGSDKAWNNIAEKTKDTGYNAKVSETGLIEHKANGASDLNKKFDAKEAPAENVSNSKVAVVNEKNYTKSESSKINYNDSSIYDRFTMLNKTKSFNGAVNANLQDTVKSSLNAERKLGGEKVGSVGAIKKVVTANFMKKKFGELASSRTYFAELFKKLRQSAFVRLSAGTAVSGFTGAILASAVCFGLIMSINDQFIPGNNADPDNIALAGDDADETSGLQRTVDHLWYLQDAYEHNLVYCDTVSKTTRDRNKKDTAYVNQHNGLYYYVGLGGTGYTDANDKLNWEGQVKNEQDWPSELNRVNSKTAGTGYNPKTLTTVYANIDGDPKFVGFNFQNYWGPEEAEYRFKVKIVVPEYKEKIDPDTHESSWEIHYPVIDADFKVKSVGGLGYSNQENIRANISKMIDGSIKTYGEDNGKGLQYGERHIYQDKPTDNTPPTPPSTLETEKGGEGTTQDVFHDYGNNHNDPDYASPNACVAYDYLRTIQDSEVSDRDETHDASTRLKSVTRKWGNNEYKENIKKINKNLTVEYKYKGSKYSFAITTDDTKNGGKKSYYFPADPQPLTDDAGNVITDVNKDEDGDDLPPYIKVDYNIYEMYKAMVAMTNVFTNNEVEDFDFYKKYMEKRFYENLNTAKIEIKPTNPEGFFVESSDEKVKMIYCDPVAKKLYEKYGYIERTMAEDLIEQEVYANTMKCYATLSITYGGLGNKGIGLVDMMERDKTTDEEAHKPVTHDEDGKSTIKSNLKIDDKTSPYYATWTGWTQEVPEVDWKLNNPKNDFKPKTEGGFDIFEQMFKNVDNIAKNYKTNGKENSDAENGKFPTITLDGHGNAKKITNSQLTSYIDWAVMIMDFNKQDFNDYFEGLQLPTSSVLEDIVEDEELTEEDATGPVGGQEGGPSLGGGEVGHLAMPDLENGVFLDNLVYINQARVYKAGTMVRYPKSPKPSYFENSACLDCSIMMIYYHYFADANAVTNGDVQHLWETYFKNNIDQTSGGLQTGTVTSLLGLSPSGAHKISPGSGAYIMQQFAPAIENLKLGNPVLLHIWGDTAGGITHGNFADGKENGHFLIMVGADQTGIYVYDPGRSKNTNICISWESLNENATKGLQDSSTGGFYYKLYNRADGKQGVVSSVVEGNAVSSDLPPDERIAQYLAYAEQNYPNLPLTKSLGRVWYQAPGEEYGHDESYYATLKLDYLKNPDSTINRLWNAYVKTNEGVAGHSMDLTSAYSDSSGVIRINGYVVVAADTNRFQRGSTVQTSLGPGIIVDHCEASEIYGAHPNQYDIAVTSNNWGN